VKTVRTVRTDDERTTDLIPSQGTDEIAGIRPSSGRLQGGPPRRGLVIWQALRMGLHPWLVVLIQAGAAVLTLVIFIGAVVAGIEGLGQLVVWGLWLWQRLGN
jgi:hypothetical protein